MPELPEVECLSRAVEHRAQGYVLDQIVFHRNSLRELIPTREFQNRLIGRKLLSVERRSKYMIWHFESDHSAIFHLGMSGNLFEEKSLEPVKNHTHVVFFLSHPQKKKNIYFHFVDPRRFGRLDLCRTSKLEQHRFMVDLGAEPLAHKNLGAYLYEKSRCRRVPIKNFLMDSSILVGVGNIYASESLFRAKIRPKRPAQKLSSSECVLLATEVQGVLSRAIARGGTSFRDYRHSDGQEGQFASELFVYGRAKAPCLLCKRPIRQLRLGGRSSFYCPSCQK